MRRAILGLLLDALCLTGVHAAEPLYGIPRRVYDARVMLLGYSIPEYMVAAPALTALKNGIISGSVSPVVRSAEVINNAVSGSFACGENGAILSGQSNYWALYNGGSPTAGPYLTSALSEIAARLATSVTHPTPDPPTAFLAGLGGEDARYYHQIGSQVATQYTVCMEYIIAQVEAALGGSGPVPFYFDVIQRYGANISTDGSFGGLDAIRAQQLTNVMAYANVYPLPEVYDYGMISTSGHPDLNFQASWGSRWAAAIAKHQYGGTNSFLGPTISTCTSSGSTISVAIAPESGDTLATPSSALGPWGFAFYDGTTPLNATWIGWNGNTAQWNAGESNVAALHCKYISDWGPGFDPTRVVSGVTSTMPLRQKQF